MKMHSKLLLFAVGFVASVGVSLSCETPKATALSGSQFNAGRIIDDGVFYNSGTMSVGEIQAFFELQGSYM